MHKTLDKNDEKEESLTISSKDSTNLSFSKPSLPSPSIRVIGFRNFVPAFDVKLSESEAKSVKESRDFKEVKLDDSLLVIKLPKLVDTVHSPVIEVYEAGPFLLFAYSESMRNGHFKTVMGLDKVRVCYSKGDAGDSEDMLLNDEDLFIVEVNESECVYIVAKEEFAKKMKLYEIPEEISEDYIKECLKGRINTLELALGKNKIVKPEELISLGIVSKGLFGECYRSFCKESKRYYSTNEIVIKSPEVLAIVLQQLDVLTKILKSQYSELSSVVSLQIIEGEDYEPLRLSITSDLGIGTLEEFSAFRSQNKEEWKEEELIKVLTELLRQCKAFDDLNITVRDIRPSNIVLYKESNTLRFLDFSLAYLSKGDSLINETTGMLKYMGLETLDESDQIKVVKHDAILADLYSIGLTVMDLLCYEDKGSSRRELMSGKVRTQVKDQNPILWDRLLGKLLEPEPLNRKEVIQDLKSSREEMSFIEKNSKKFESFIAEKELAVRKELLNDYETFLSYFWDLESLSLIDKLDKEIIDKFKATGDSLRRVTRFSQKLAALYEKKGMWERYIATYERLADILENEKTKKQDEDTEMQENNPNDHNPLLLELYSKIGSTYKSHKNYTKALEYYEKALYLEYLKDPEDVTYDFKNHIEIAEVYEELGHKDLALDTYTKVQERFKQSFGNKANQLQEAILFERIAGLYYRRNELLSAIEEAERAIQSYTTCYGKQHVTVGNCERLLGDVYRKAGDLEEAMKHYEIYFANHLNGPAKYDIEPAKLSVEIGDYYKNKGLYAEAMENYQRSLNVYQYHDDESALCSLYEKLAECYAFQKKFILAVKTLRMCYNLKVSSLGENNLELVPIIEKIANNYVRDGEHNEALKEYSRALSIAMIYKPNDDPVVTEILKKIGAISPLAFLAYKNYRRTSTGTLLGRKTGFNKTDKPILISFNKIEDVKGVLGGIDFNMSLYELREMISKECAYLGFFKYNFIREGKEVDILGEKLVKVEECIVRKDGFNHLVVQEGKSVARERMTC